MTTDTKNKVMIIAGEASGDCHGARLVRAMLELNQDLSFFGIGGNALRKAGVHIRIDNSRIAVVGLSEAIIKLGILLKALKIAKRELKRCRPNLLIVIDFPDFNLLVAKAAKKLGIPVFYYISPQIWAWRTGRVKKIRRLVDHMVVIFPFEADFYRRSRVPVTFVGHPLLDSIASGETLGETNDLDTKDMVIGLLPGSRNEEVLRLLPVMVEVADIITEQMPGLLFAIPLAPSADKTTVESIIGKAKSRFLVLSDRLQDILARATLLITASGTVTLEATIAGTPMIIIYKVSGLSYWLGKRLIRVKHIGLPNLVAGKPIVPEFVQHQATAKNIARQALALLKDENSLAGMRLQLNHTAQALGPPGASRKAAKVALAMLQPH